jgi:acyl-CoA reductase-like NAD-dependent aldehyde dehydrogenase
MKIHNPATGALIAEVGTDTSATIRGKYQRARAAQAAWAELPVKKRLATIAAFRGRVASTHEALARALTDEVGKPIRQSREEIAGLASRLDFFLKESPRTLRGETVLADLDNKLEERITREPLGVVANVSTWDFPYYVGSNVFVPALISGNAVLYKPSEYATLTGLHIARLLHEAGVPEDVFVPVIGDGFAGATLLRQPVDGVFFTGSSATGRKIAANAGRRMIRVQLELGGKDPVYVCDDIDVEAVAAEVAQGAFYNNGQSSCAVERIYVAAPIHDAFVAAFVASVRALRIGDPRDESTDIGPLARRSQIGVLKRQVVEARRLGGNVLIGGEPIDRRGNWFQPTVIANADHRMSLMREESFGPVIGLARVLDDDEAIARMNDSPYGLTAGVYTRSEKRAKRILSRMRTGTVYWNCCDRVSPRLPWSGVGHSGLGLTLSTYGIQAFTRPKSWHLRSPQGLVA